MPEARFIDSSDQHDAVPDVHEAGASRASRIHSVPPVATLDLEDVFASSPEPETLGDNKMPNVSIPDMLRQLPEHGKWLINALDGLHDAARLGPEYNSLLRQLIIFESLSTSQVSKRNVLPSSKRPLALSNWVKSGRRTTPNIRDLKTFVQEWKIYWASLQPRWRKRNKDGNFSTSERGDDWGNLHCPGINGIFGLVGGLNGWGTKVIQTSGGRKDQESWKAAVADLSWVMEGLISSARTQRTAEEDELLHDG
jgi:hypothetical protein